MKNIKYIFGVILILMLFSFGTIVSGTGTHPVLSNEFPIDDSTNIAINQATVNVTIFDLEETFNWTIQGLYITNTGANGASNGSKSANIITPLPFNTEVIWIVNVTDGTNWTNATYSFTSKIASRLTDNIEGSSNILVAGLVSLFLFLGLIVYSIDALKKKTFNLETFITLLVAVIVIAIALSFI